VMHPEVHVFCEGDRRLRRAFDRFVSGLRFRAESRGIRLRMVPCKDRHRALDSFVRSVQGPSHIRGILLVDAEGAVAGSCWGKPWTHLGSLQAARLHRPDKARDDDAHLMVQIMESWFLADREALLDYYGSRFRPSSLPAEREIEKIPKSRVLNGLKRSTASTRKGEYHKAVHAPEILARIDPARVRAASPWCDRLFKTIESAIETA
jgi:hypothetical protein